jgi:hypothetical protein
MYVALLLIAIVPQSAEPEPADLVEVNHCYSRDTGERRFVQVIYWGAHDGSTLHVREWHMMEKCQAIYRVADRPKMPITVVRQREGATEIIRARRFLETYTYFDPEEKDRQILPMGERRPLAR